MITIRRSKKEDETAVVDLINSIMDREFHDAKHAYPTEDVESIEKSYGGIGEAFFVAIDNQTQKVVGTVAIKKEDGRVALLRRLFVAPTHRNLKIGKRLIDRALEFCREVGYEEVVFKTTSKMSGAIDLCKRNGFTQRAHIVLGPIELVKLSLCLREDVHALKEKV
ncbi:MAG TPA: GNAT family N-acetyltransferase [Candidatus Omnitrophota bacterium]|nr:GNAT family N-acetyltransferase [Candidatus Omnitrophota bacterium]HRY85279.1 GNAT family N-acetyltransferase [Candidatus Omnitrophota bacterium]